MTASGLIGKLLRFSDLPAFVGVSVVGLCSDLGYGRRQWELVLKMVEREI